MPPATPSADQFAAWLAAARQGEAFGFAGLYDWLGPEVKRFATGRGARDPDAITNDAILAAFNRLHEFEGGAAAFRSWVFAISRNRLIDSHRFESRRPSVGDGERGAETAARVVSAEDLALAGLGNERVRTLLAHLTGPQQEVLLLRVVHGLSLQETADAVHRPVSAVKRLQARALSTLRREISGKGVSS